MQKKTLLRSTAIALPLLLVTSLGVSAAYAADTTGTTSGGTTITQGVAQGVGMHHGGRGGANDANRLAIEAAISANDFAKFQTLSASSPFSGITTQAQFDQLVKAHALMASGDTAGAKAIWSTLGVKGPGMGHGMGRGHGGFGNPAAHTAVEQGDFTAWKSAMAGYNDQSKLTQELFDKMVAVEKLQKEIRATLGN